MHQFRFKVSEKVYNIKSLLRSNESDYNKFNAIYEKIYSFNDGFKSFDFNTKNHAQRTNVIKIDLDKMRFIGKYKILLNMSYDILLSIYPMIQSRNSIEFLIELKILKEFINSPDTKNYKEILKLLRKIELKFYEYVNILSNNFESYHKAYQFISAIKEFVNLFKNLVESEKINYNFFKGFIKSICVSELEKLPDQLNICSKYLSRYYHEHLY